MEVHRGAERRTAQLGELLARDLAGVTGDMAGHLAATIEPLQGDEQLLRLLAASTESNLDALARIMRYAVRATEPVAPIAAQEFARLLAQRGISSNAMVRAYRLGQEGLLDWALDQLAEMESDPAVAVAAARHLVELTFGYIDAISEQVVHTYEAERERWLAHRSTVRVAMVSEILGGGQPAIEAAERALGYRLRQQHLGIVLWSRGATSGLDMAVAERVLEALSRLTRAVGQPLVHARDRAVTWAWLPLGREAVLADPALLALEIEQYAGQVLVATGTPAAGVEGFRTSHLESLRAQQLAMAAGDAARPLTSYDDAEVRAGAMLAGDLESTRRLVRSALGRLAEDTAGSARLRETLHAFLGEQGSYTATAERLHLHKNTVRYRVERATEARGRPLDDDRFELELALVAARWLGSTVLVEPG
ncbi:PucR family transcriptional regulator [Nocardioides caricicola]|uniref:PucR family transcriptional regulator n=1 Tax=Nocardioides caricicola TaxID=634770 RepID=A0ABW0N210_9ACTN